VQSRRHDLPAAFFLIGRRALYLTAFAPLLWSDAFLVPAVIPRVVLFRSLVAVALAAFLVLFLTHERPARLKPDAILLCLLVYVSALAVSAAFGFAPMHSLFSDLQRMGGLVMWTWYVLFYLMLRFFFEEAHWRRYFELVSVAALTHAVIAIAQHWLALDQLTDVVRGARAGGLTGNPAYLAAYLGIAIAAPALLYSHYGARRAWLLAVCTAVLLYAIALTNTLSMIAGLVVGALAGLVFLAWATRRKRFVVAAAAMATVVLGSILLAFALPGAGIVRAVPALARIADARAVGTESIHVRVDAWHAAWNGFRARPLTGAGPENFAAVYARYMPPSTCVRDSGGLDRAHNAYLEHLATTGLLGTLAFTALWLCYLLVLLNAHRKGRVQPLEAAILLFAAGAYLTYLTLWFEDFNSSVPLFALMAFLSFRNSGSLLSFEAQRAGIRPRVLAAAAVVVVLSVAAWSGAYALRGAHSLRAALAAQTAEERLAYFADAAGMAGPLDYETLIPYVDFLASLESQRAQLRARPQQAALVRGAIRSASGVADRLVEANPLDGSWRQERSRLLWFAARFEDDGRLARAAMEDLLAAVRVNPNRVIFYNAVADRYVDARRPDVAELWLGRAAAVHDCGSTHLVRARIHLAGNEPARAAASLERAAELKAYRHALTMPVVHILVQDGQAERAAQLISTYFRWKDPGQTARAFGDVVLTGEDRVPAVALPLLWLRAGHREEAVAAMRRLMQLDPLTSEYGARFIADVRAGRVERWSAVRIPLQ
jgi:O-antigen ligase/tetratricopeptide (TPR) repeat protein